MESIKGSNIYLGLFCLASIPVLINLYSYKNYYFFMAKEQVLAGNKVTPSKLILIKSIHTAVWVFFNALLAYLFYAVFTDQIGLWFWLGIAAYFIEFVVLLLYGWNCPLTFWARKYSDSTKDNFDIYLPNWFARHNKTIYSILIVLLFLLFVFTQFLEKS